MKDTKGRPVDGADENNNDVDDDDDHLIPSSIIVLYPPPSWKRTAKPTRSRTRACARVCVTHGGPCARAAPPMTMSRLCSTFCVALHIGTRSFSTNVEPRIFMVASQGLGFEEIRPARNACLPRIPFSGLANGSLVSGDRWGRGKEILGLISIIFRGGY